MKLNKFLFIIVSIFTMITILTSQLTNSSINFSNDIINVENIKRLSFGNMSSLEDGAVYFIRNKVNTNKVFDVPGANYSNDNQIELYDFLGWGNQRFVLEKSFDNTYRIRTLDANRLYLSVEGNSSETNKRILLRKEGNYNNSTILTDKFKIEYNYTYSAFTISTAISEYNKYIGLSEYNTNNKNVLVQSDLNKIYEVYFMWVFEKTTTLGVDVDNNDFYEAWENKWYLFNMQYSINFYIELNHASNIISKLSIHQDNADSTLIKEVKNTIDGTSTGVKMLVHASAFSTLKINVQNLSANNGTIKIWIYPEKTVLMTTMYDIGKNNIDSATLLLDSIPNIVRAGYYPTVQTNLPLSFAEEYSRNGKRKINSDLFFDIHHGNPGGTLFYDGTNCDGGWLDILNMPSFSGTDFAFWGSCNSATTSENHNNSGYTSNLALESVNKGAKNSVGFKGETLSVAVPYFVNKFIENYSNTSNILTATKYASNETNSKYWAQLIFIPALKTPYLYSRKNDGSIVTYNGNTSALLSNKISNYLETHETLNNTFNINSSKDGPSYIKIDNIYTNFQYSISNFTFVQNKLNEFRKNSDFSKANFFLYNKSKFYLLNVKYLSGDTFEIIDLETQKYISQEEFVQISELIKGDII